MSDSEGEDNGGLSGFLFGNLDENNQLEADYLDAVRTNSETSSAALKRTFKMPERCPFCFHAAGCTGTAAEFARE